MESDEAGLGREVKRKNERIRAEEPVRIRTRQTDMEGMTLDVSEDGIAFRISGGEAVAEEEEEHCPVLKGGEQFCISVLTERYTGDLDAELHTQSRMKKAGSMRLRLCR